MDVMVLKPGCNFNETRIIDDKDKVLSDLQKIVEGYIDIPYMNTNLEEAGIDFIINDEGLLKSLKPSLIFMKNKKIINLIVGNIIFASHDIEGNIIGLDAKQKELIINTLNNSCLISDSITGEQNITLVYNY